MNPAKALYLSAVLLLLQVALTACSSSSNNTTRSSGNIRTEEQSYAFVAEGPYADVLKQCVRVGTVADSCALSTLPLIGMRSAGRPEKEAILEHVLVTHDWMGERFAELLDILPDDIRSLLGAVTAIYIGSDVRPSYYSTLNGAIHLDPAGLWLYADEKSSVSKAEDYRSSFGADLQLDFYRWFLKNGRPAWDYYNLDDRSERTLQDIRLPMARLLYHELAHANDFLPATEHSSLDSTKSVYAAVDSVRSDWRSPLLQSDYPLNSAELRSIAQVRYRGFTATEEDSNITPAYAGAQLELDGGAYLYGYSAEAEELAGLFVAAMMKYHFDVSMSVAFVNKPRGSLIRGCQLSLGWGRQNRLANTLVAARARIATRLLLGEDEDFTRFLDEFLGNSFDRETGMTEGADWCPS